MAKEDQDFSGLKKFDQALSQARGALSPTVPTQLLQAFIKVALQEGKTLSEYAEELQSNLSTASRHFLDLGELDRNGNPGFNVVDRREDPVNRREKRYTLTPKGKILARNILASME